MIERYSVFRGKVKRRGGRYRSVRESNGNVTPGADADGKIS